MTYRTAWLGPATPTHTYTVAVSPVKGEWLFGWFCNDAVGDNFNWPAGWRELKHITTTTNSMDLWLGVYGPCNGTETTWDFSDDSGVSKLLGGVTAFNNIPQDGVSALQIDVLTGLDYVSASTDSNQTSPWSQATGSVQWPAGEIFGVMGHDLFPSTNDLVVTLSASDTLGSVWTKRDKLDDPFAGPSSGFLHIGTITGQQVKTGANVITFTGTCSDGTVPAARGIILVSMRQVPLPRTARPKPISDQYSFEEDPLQLETDIRGWF